MVTWRDIAVILVLEAFIDVLLDKFVKDPAMRTWSRLLDRLEAMRHGKAQEGKARDRPEVRGADGESPR
jgi:hypothetical protein